MKDELAEREAERPNVRSSAERVDEENFSDPRRRRKWLPALGFLIQRMDIPFLGLIGTNLLGLLLAFAAFLPLGFLMQRFGARIEGVVTFLGGGIVFGADWIFRRKFDILFEEKHGARLFYLPMWIWGIIWMVVGIIKVIIELIKG
jgi:hypothetical protein